MNKQQMELEDKDPLIVKRGEKRATMLKSKKVDESVDEGNGETISTAATTVRNFALTLCFYGCF